MPEIPRSVWLITALWVALLMGSSLLWPATYGYDEPQHIDMAYVYAGDPFHLYGPGELAPTVASIRVQAAQPGYPPRYRFSVVPIPSRGDRPSFEDLGGRARTTGTQPNQMVQHPPVPYWLDAVVLRLPGVSSLAWDLQVWLLRLMGIVLVVPVPALCWATARRLLRFEGAARAESAALVAAVIPLGIPNLLRDLASVTNDTMLLAASSVMLYLLARVLTGDLRLRTGVGIGVALAVALLSKAFALMFPPFIFVAYLVGARRAERWTRAVPGLVAAGVGGLVGASWWIRNKIVHGSIQPSGYGPGYERVLFGEPDHRGTLSVFLPRFFTDLTMRLWGGIGLPDSPYPGNFLAYSWLAVALIGIVASLLIRARRGSRTNAWVLFGVIVATVGTVTQSSFGLYRLYSDVPRTSQGRYLFHLIVAITALTVVGWARTLRPELLRRLPAYVLGAGLLTVATSWVMIIKSWYASGTEWRFFGGGLHGLLRWSPVPSLVTALVVVALPAALGLACLVVLFRAGPSPEEGGEVPLPEGLRVDRSDVLA